MNFFLIYINLFKLHSINDLEQSLFNNELKNFFDNQTEDVVIKDKIICNTDRCFGGRLSYEVSISISFYFFIFLILY